MDQAPPLNPIAPLDLAAERAQLGAELERAVVDVLHSGMYVLGPEVQRFEQDFAALCGVSPVDASSGKHQTHRLNRGGNRHANNALHTVALQRWRTCPETRAYIQRRRAEGRTDRHIRRCLKRALARRFHRHLLNDLAALT